MNNSPSGDARITWICLICTDWHREGKRIKTIANAGTFLVCRLAHTFKLCRSFPSILQIMHCTAPPGLGAGDCGSARQSAAVRDEEEGGESLLGFCGLAPRSSSSGCFLFSFGPTQHSCMLSLACDVCWTGMLSFGVRGLDLGEVS